VRAAQPPLRSCCPPGSQSIFCDAHRATTLPAQYRFLPALRHVEASLTLILTLTLIRALTFTRTRTRTRTRTLTLPLTFTLTLTLNLTPTLTRHVKASAAFVARRFRWLVLVDDDSFVFPTHLRWHAASHPQSLCTPAARLPPPPHDRLMPTVPPAAPFRYLLCPFCTPAILPLNLRNPSASPLCISNAGCSAGSMTPSRSTLATLARLKRPGS